MYVEEDMLMLSGIQHYKFCPRQWALIHIEQQWQDNRLTIEGELMHKHVDDPFYRQKCGDCITLRGVHIASHELGLYGITDVIELHPATSMDDSILHPAYPGRWIPIPVEYKHGMPKRNEIDEVQLAAQAMCLEELYGIRISSGAIFYGETRHRTQVDFTDRLRQIVKQCADEMHQLYARSVTPHAMYERKCERCSLKDICMPDACGRLTVDSYLKNNLYL